MAPAPVPNLEVADPSGARIVVAPRSTDDRVGELADAIGLPPAVELAVDGRPVRRLDSLGRAGVVRGSRLAPAAAPRGEAAAPVVVVTCEAGPAAGAAVALPPGRHVVGRSASAAVRIDEPGVEAHHGVLDVAADGTAAFLQLTGRVPCRADGHLVEAATPLRAGGVVTIGASRLRVSAVGDEAPPAAALARVAADPWRRALRRVPRAVPHWDPAPIEVPATPVPPSRAGATGLVAAALAAAGAAVVAVVMGSVVFVVFAVVGLATAVGVWTAGGLGTARARARQQVAWAREVASVAAAVERQRDARRGHHAATTPDIATAVAAAGSLSQHVWCRRAGHPDVHRASIGRGDVAWDVRLAAGADALGGDLAPVVAGAAELHDVPVPVDLGPGAALAITGVEAVAVARSLVVQLAVGTGPADLRLVVVAADPDAWSWCAWLPHTSGADGSHVVAADDPDRLAAVLRALDDGSARHVVVVTDRADALSQRTGPLRRFLGGPLGAAVVAVIGPDGSPPAMCRSILQIGSTGRGRWWADAAVDGHPVGVHVAGADVVTASAAARALAGLCDPEDPGRSGGAPVAVTLGTSSARHGTAPIDDPIAIAAGWRGAGADPAPVAVLGSTADGVVEVDLARDGPHALVAGTTGSGKSELLRTLVVSLAARCSPAHVTFVLVDYKGGSTFDACADLPHTVGLVTDLDDELAARALASLDAEVRRREVVLRGSGAVDLSDHRSRGGEPLARLVVVVDEFATLAAELPEFLGALVGVAQRGRSLGIHLVLATQRPSGVVSDDIRANTNLRIALRLQDAADARDVVGTEAPATFPRGAPGRAVLRLGADEHVVFQVACSSAPAEPVHDDRLHLVGPPAGPGGGESELATLVRTIRNAAALSDVERPHRPWVPPLPAHVTAADLAALDLGAGAIGIVDDPAGQRRRALRWRPADGNVAIIGAVGAGTTTALLATVLGAVTDRAAGECHVYVVDARGDHRLDALAGDAHCGGVVRPHERERLSRLLRRLTDELDARRAATPPSARPDVVLAVDGLPALRAVLDDPLDHADLDALGRVVTEGPAVGVVTVLTAERPAALPASVLATCPTRWLGHLDDPSEAAVCGVRAALVPRATPGRFVAAGSLLVAQLVEPAPSASRSQPGPGGPPPIDVLPAEVALAPAGLRSGGEVRLTVGVDFATLGPAVLAVPDGEHVLVAGPPRSGRTSALAALAAAWRAAHPGGRVRVVAAGRAGPWDPAELTDVDEAVESATGRPAGAPVLVVVDDAERVDDARLGVLAAERRPGLLIAAAGRPDGLRPLYGHWTGVVRRSRVGALLAACVDVDGDLLGELLARRPPIPARPGLAWLVDATGRRLVQLSR